MKSPLRTAIAVLVLLGSASIADAQSIPVHSVWSDNSPLLVRDGITGVWSTPSLSFFSANWQEGTNQAFVHALATSGGHVYEFRLIGVATSTDNEIDKLWDVYKDGVIACNHCLGHIYGLTAPIGSHFKIYIGTPLAFGQDWFFSAYVTNRFDY